MGTVFFSILNQMEINLVQNWNENCHHDHIPFNFKVKGNLVFWVYGSRNTFNSEYFQHDNSQSDNFHPENPHLEKIYYSPARMYCAGTVAQPATMNGATSRDKWSKHTDKTMFPFSFTLNEIWSWWQFSFRFLTKWNSIWFKIKKENCHHNNIPFDLKGNGNTVFSACVCVCGGRVWWRRWSHLRVVSAKGSAMLLASVQWLTSTAQQVWCASCEEVTRGAMWSVSISRHEMILSVIECIAKWYQRNTI